MLLLLEIKRHILRMPGRTVITALTAALLVCGMAFYMRNIQVTEAALDDMADQMPVQVKITNRDGSRTSNISIKSEDFDAFAAGDLRDVLCTSPFLFTVKSVNGEPSNGSMHVHAANQIAALDGPDPESFTYLEGWDEGFLQAGEPVCALERSYAEENGLGLGDELEAELFTIRVKGGGYDPVAVHTLTVVALYKDSGLALGSWDGTVPIDWLRGLTDSAVDRYGSRIPFFYDSASAYIADPRELNAFKYAMKEHGFRQRSPLPDVQIVGDALSIDDEMYIKTSCEMIESLELYNTFLAPFFGLIILAVALITFLTLRSSRRHIAIASSLGRQKLLNAAAPFFGTVLVQAAGCSLGLCAMGIIVGMAFAQIWGILGIFMLCAILGTTLALAFLFRFDTLALLMQTD